MVDPTDVDFMIRLMQNRIANGIKTLCVKPHAADLEDSVNHNPNVVKVVVINGKCHWFSRAPMANSLFHIGVYGFGSTKLAGLEFAEETDYSRAEGLEQLAWIEKGHIIRPVLVAKTPLSINSKEDMTFFRGLVENEDARRPD